MKKRTTLEDLQAQLDRLNTAGRLARLPEYRLDAGYEGRFKLVDSKGRGVLGASTGLGTGSIPKRDLLQRMEDFTFGIEVAYLANRSDKVL